MSGLAQLWHRARARPKRTEEELRRQSGALSLAQEELNRHASQLEELMAQLTASLQQIVSELEGLSYTISHDLRAPLRAIQGFAYALNENYGPGLDDAGRDYLRRIMQASIRLDRLLVDVLTYSYTARTELILEPVDLDALTEEIVDEYPALRGHKANIRVEAPLGQVVGHRPSVQCVSNLLGNAVKFVGPGAAAEIRIWTERRGGRRRLNMADRGIGIAPEHLGKVFGMFERVATSYDGTGVGLAIVRKAVERMNGIAGVDSELGRGSCFWIDLPDEGGPGGSD